ncbi:MAG: response regulator transcription factor [Mycobacteriaceae bacterium]
MSENEDVLAARVACSRGDWRAAYEGFGRASGAAELDTDDLSSFGMIAWRLGYGRESIRLSEEAFNRLIAENQPQKAAMKAAEVALQWFNGGDWTITRVWLNRARRLVEQSPDDQALAYLLYVDSQVSICEGRFDDGSRRAEELQELVSRIGSPGLNALSWAASGLAKLPFARTSEGFAELDEAMLPVLAGQVPVDWASDIYCGVIHECHRLEDLSRMKTWTTAMDKWREGPEVAASWYGTTCEIYKWQLLSATDDYRALEERLSNALAGIEDFHAPTTGQGYYELGDMRRRQGDLDGARAAFARAREIGFDPQPGEALLRCQLGEAAAAGNDLRMRMDAEDEVGRIRLLPAVVEIALARDSIDEADHYCSELEAGAEKYDSPGFRAWALHARGAVLVRQGRPAEALPILHDAMRRYRHTQRRYEMAQVYEWMELAHRATGDTASAASEAANAESIYQQLGAQSARAVNRAAPGGLTNREVEVLARIAAGASNREVAKQLFISDKTVGRHLANIFVKLGVSSRTAAAAWAHENGVLPGAT